MSKLYVNILKISRIVDICELCDIEIVSFGLVPNPDGFCYELPEEYNEIKEYIKELDSLLDSLNKREVNCLRDLLFR